MRSSAGILCMTASQLVGVPHAEVDEADTMITVEYYRPGSENPGDVQSCTTPLVGAVEAMPSVSMRLQQCPGCMRRQYRTNYCEDHYPISPQFCYPTQNRHFSSATTRNRYALLEPLWYHHCCETCVPSGSAIETCAESS